MATHHTIRRGLAATGTAASLLPHHISQAFLTAPPTAAQGAQLTMRFNMRPHHPASSRLQGSVPVAHRGLHTGPQPPGSAGGGQLQLAASPGGLAEQICSTVLAARHLLHLKEPEPDLARQLFAVSPAFHLAQPVAGPPRHQGGRGPGQALCKYVCMEVCMEVCGRASLTNSTLNQARQSAARHHLPPRASHPLLPERLPAAVGRALAGPWADIPHPATATADRPARGVILSTRPVDKKLQAPQQKKQTMQAEVYQQHPALPQQLLAALLCSQQAVSPCRHPPLLRRPQLHDAGMIREHQGLIEGC